MERQKLYECNIEVRDVAGRVIYLTPKNRYVLATNKAEAREKSGFGATLFLHSMKQLGLSPDNFKVICSEVKIPGFSITLTPLEQKVSS